MSRMDMNALKEIPGYKPIMKIVLQSQIQLLVSQQYCKLPQYSDTQKITVSCLTFEQCGFTVELYVQKMQMEWQKSADPDQTAPRALFAETFLVDSVIIRLYNRGPDVCAHVIWHLFNELGKRIRYKALLSILSLLPDKVNDFINSLLPSLFHCISNFLLSFKDGTTNSQSSKQIQY